MLITQGFGYAHVGFCKNLMFKRKTIKKQFYIDKPTYTFNIKQNRFYFTIKVRDGD